MFDAKSRLERFQKGVATLQSDIPAIVERLMEFIGTTQAEGALTVREKELIAIGVAVCTTCEDCIAVHAKKALDAGCKREEILEAAAMGIIFGGGPALGAAASLLVDALDQFANND